MNRRTNGKLEENPREREREREGEKNSSTTVFLHVYLQRIVKPKDTGKRHGEAARAGRVRLLILSAALASPECGSVLPSVPVLDPVCDRLVL